MANPKLEGVTKENRPYSLTPAGDPGFDNSGLIELEASAKLPINTKDWATIGARRGVYDRVANTLEFQPIKVKTTEGMTAMLQSAYVDIAKGSLTTGDPVDIELKGGHSVAGSLSVLDKGNELVFEKCVKMNIDANPGQGSRSGEGRKSENDRKTAACCCRAALAISLPARLQRGKFNAQTTQVGPQAVRRPADPDRKRQARGE